MRVLAFGIPPLSRLLFQRVFEELAALLRRGSLAATSPLLLPEQSEDEAVLTAYCIVAGKALIQASVPLDLSRAVLRQS